MKFVFRRVSVGVVFLALFASIQSASAYAVRFSQEWDSGALLTGDFDVDETPLGFPPYNWVYYFSLTSFHAHWSGDAHSAPYDFDLQDMYPSSFTWNIDTHSIVQFGIDDTAPGNIWIDGNNFIDWRIIDAKYYTTTTHPMQLQRVPDGGSTGMLLGIALVALFPMSSTLRRWRRR